MAIRRQNPPHHPQPSKHGLLPDRVPIPWKNRGGMGGIPIPVMHRDMHKTHGLARCGPSRPGNAGNGDGDYGVGTGEGSGGHGHSDLFADGTDALKQVLRDIDAESLDVLSPYITGDIAQFRGLELAAAVKRMRTLQMRQEKS